MPAFAGMTDYLTNDFEMELERTILLPAFVMRILLRMKKRVVRLIIDGSLLYRARARKVDLSEVLERALKRRLPAPNAWRWAEQNRDAIRAFNERIAKDGPLNRDLISF